MGRKVKRWANHTCRVAKKRFASTLTVHAAVSPLCGSSPCVLVFVAEERSLVIGCKFGTVGSAEKKWQMTGKKSLDGLPPHQPKLKNGDDAPSSSGCTHTSLPQAKRLRKLPSQIKPNRRSPLLRQEQPFVFKAEMDSPPTRSAMPTGDNLEQPWRAFWPPKVDHLTKSQLEERPWLTWRPEPDKPDTKPWYDWLSKDPAGTDVGVVCRRGAI